MTALVLALMVLALMIADVALAVLAHQGLPASGGSLPPWLSAPFVTSDDAAAERRPEHEQRLEEQAHGPFAVGVGTERILALE